VQKLNRYIARAVVGAVAMVLLLVLGLDFIGKLIDQLDSLQKNYTFFEALIYILWGLPRSAYEYLPYAVLVGCLIGLGNLASSSELVVMRAAGVSVGRIVWMVLKPVLLFILLGVALGEYVIPYADQAAESRRAIALGYSDEGQARRGVWHREANEFIQFNVIQPGGNLRGVSRYRFVAGKLEEASFTHQVEYRDGVWHETSVLITDFTGEQLTTKRLPEREWHTDLTPKLLDIVAVPPEAQSIESLHEYVGYLKEQGLKSSEYNLAFWQKLLQPLATASLVLIAISFVFGPLREVTMGQRIFTGVVFGIVFRLIQSLLGPSSIVFGFPPLIAVLVPIGLCLLLGFFLLRRAA